jgi:hypothetical protein
MSNILSLWHWWEQSKTPFSILTRFYWSFSPFDNNEKKGIFLSPFRVKLHLRWCSPCLWISPSLGKGFDYEAMLVACFPIIYPPRIMFFQPVMLRIITPPIFSTRWKICYHCNLLLLQYTTTLLEHSSRMICYSYNGPWTCLYINHLNSCHTIHQVYANHTYHLIHQRWRKIYVKNMCQAYQDHQQVPLSIYQQCSLNKCHITHDMTLY